ncbi:hypothetical protein JTB14_020488 [Gonioctena quinquepunctata]|nr:hypothetical protein JTB14_020488 [Gonioctena quinquepunctata]
MSTYDRYIYYTWTLLVAEEIDCDINGEYIITCRKEGDEVYIPFSFLHKYFEVYGKLATYDGLERFEWSHSYSKVYHPKAKYDPRGVFMYFENYNVEVRDRVRCVSAIEGVPVSTQWDSQGYYYPTQIAQFGLSHYSKNLTEPEPRRKIIEDCEQNVNWIVPVTAKLENVFESSVASRILRFSTSDKYMDGIHLAMDHNRETKEIFHLHYITSDVWITVQNNNVYHGIGTFQEWKKLTRDLVIDLQKGMSYLDKEKSKHKILRSKIKIIDITLRGSGALDNLTLSSSEHIQQFYDAAEWFLKHQDRETGGWAIPVKRKLANGFHDLQPGWYSSMGQGHAISVLSRAYHHSGGDIRFLSAALKGLKPFEVPSAEGGVRATFVDKYHCQPLCSQRFIYSLLGIYDLITIAPPGEAQEAELLYNEGLESLKNMLMLFDMGSVTSYDLRHFTIGTSPNLARWDYHATHINQLLLLSTITNEQLFKIIIEILSTFLLFGNYRDRTGTSLGKCLLVDQHQF